jgi:hypothetical protein
MLTIALSVGLVASVKRLWIGFFLGKKAFGKNKTTPLLLNIKLHFVFEISKPNPPEANYADDLATVMEKILLMSQVATLARKFERQFAFSLVSQRTISLGFWQVPMTMTTTTSTVRMARHRHLRSNTSSPCQGPLLVLILSSIQKKKTESLVV